MVKYLKTYGDGFTRADVVVAGVVHRAYGGISPLGWFHLMGVKRDGANVPVANLAPALRRAIVDAVQSTL